MVALSQDRLTTRRAGDHVAGPVAAGVVIYDGALVARNAAGDIVPGSASPSLKACGVATERANAAGLSAGAMLIVYAKGVFCFANEPTDPITKADIENNAWIVDDQTVARTNGGATRSVAGRIVDVDAAGVWVRIGL